MVSGSKYLIGVLLTGMLIVIGLSGAMSAAEMPNEGNMAVGAVGPDQLALDRPDRIDRDYILVNGSEDDENETSEDDGNVTAIVDGDDILEDIDVENQVPNSVGFISMNSLFALVMVAIIVVTLVAVITITLLIMNMKMKKEIELIKMNRQ